MGDFIIILRKLMADNKIGQNSLAKMLKISRGHVCSLVSGKRNPTPKMIDRIAEKLKLDAELTTHLHVAGAKQRGYKI